MSVDKTLAINGLVNGTKYNVRLKAVYQDGTEEVSNIAQGTPMTVPSAPELKVVTSDDGQLSLGFVAPTNNGGSAVSNYQYSVKEKGTVTATLKLLPSEQPQLTMPDVLVSAKGNIPWYSDKFLFAPGVASPEVPHAGRYIVKGYVSSKAASIFRPSTLICKFRIMGFPVSGEAAVFSVDTGSDGWGAVDVWVSSDGDLTVTAHEYGAGPQVLGRTHVVLNHLYTLVIGVNADILGHVWLDGESVSQFIFDDAMLSYVNDSLPGAFEVEDWGYPRIWQWINLGKSSSAQTQRDPFNGEIHGLRWLSGDRFDTTNSSISTVTTDTLLATGTGTSTDTKFLLSPMTQQSGSFIGNVGESAGLFISTIKAVDNPWLATALASNPGTLTYQDVTGQYLTIPDGAVTLSDAFHLKSCVLAPNGDVLNSIWAGYGSDYAFYAAHPELADNFNGLVFFSLTYGFPRGENLTSTAQYLDYTVNTGGSSWLARFPVLTSSPLVLTGLTNGKPYRVALRAVNEAGVGPSSASIDKRVAAVPDQMRISVEVQEDLTVKILTSLPDGRGEPVTHYSYSLNGGVSYTDVPLSQTLNGARIIVDPTRLVYGTNYSLRVRAKNAVGYGAATDVLKFIFTRIMGAPTILSIAEGVGQLSVDFSSPGASDRAVPTNLEYSVDNGLNWTTRSPVGVLSPLVIKPLQNGTNYQVKLRLLNAGGTGIASTATVGVPKAPPSAPINVGETPYSQQSLAVYADVAFNGGSISDTQTKSQFTINNGSTWFDGLVAASPTPQRPLRVILYSNTIPDLAPLSYTYPNVKVRVVTAQGTGPSSATGVTVHRAGEPSVTLSNIRVVSNQLVGDVVALSNGVAQPGDAGDITIYMDVYVYNENNPNVGLNENGAYQYLTNYYSSIPGPFITSEARTVVLVSDVSSSALPDGTPLAIATTYGNSVFGPSVISASGYIHQIVHFAISVVPRAPSIQVHAVPGGIAVQLYPSPTGNEHIYTPYRYKGGGTLLRYEYSVALEFGGMVWGAWQQVPLNTVTYPSTPLLPNPDGVYVATDYPQFTATGLTDGTSYAIRVRAVTDHGNGGESMSHFATPASAPSKPVISARNLPNGDISVSVTVATSGAVSVDAYFYSLDEGADVYMSPVSPFSIPSAGLINGNTYSIRVRVQNDALAYSAYSEPVSVTQKAAPGMPDTVTTERGDRQIIVNFTAPTNTGGSPILGYLLKYQPNGGTEQTLSISKLTGPLTIPNLTNGETYSVWLAARNIVGTGVYRAAAQATPAGIPPTPVITSIESVDGTYGRQLQVNVSGVSANGAATRTIRYSVDGGAFVDWYGANVPIILEHLITGHLYSVLVQVDNGVGTATSAVATGTPVRAPDAPVVGRTDYYAPQVGVHVVTPDTGGLPILGYRVYTTLLTNLANHFDTGFVPAGHPITISGLPTMDYASRYYGIAAINAKGESPITGFILAYGITGAWTPTPPPAAPVIYKVETDGSEPGALLAYFTQAPYAVDGYTGILTYEYAVKLAADVGWGPWIARATVSNNSPIQIPGLNIGSLYNVRLRAVNQYMGAGTASAASAPQGVATPVPAPVLVSLVAVSNGILATYTQSHLDPIVSYSYTLDGGVTVLPKDSVANPLAIGGLENGAAYNLKIRAHTATGYSPWSNQLSVSLPVSAPGAPTITSILAQDSSLFVYVTPGRRNGAEITSYRFSTDNGFTWLDWPGTLFPIQFTQTTSIPPINLQNGVSYSIRAAAVNAGGEGQASEAFIGVPVGRPTSAPVIRSVYAADPYIVIQFTPLTVEQTNGGAVLSYEYTTDGGSNWRAVDKQVGRELSILHETNSVGNLVVYNGTYTVQIRALNAAGFGPSSLPHTLTFVPPTGVSWGIMQAWYDAITGQPILKLRLPTDNGGNPQSNTPSTFGNIELSKDGDTWSPLYYESDYQLDVLSEFRTVRPYVQLPLHVTADFYARVANAAGQRSTTKSLSLTPEPWRPYAPQTTNNTAANKAFTLKFNPLTYSAAAALTNFRDTLPLTGVFVATGAIHQGMGQATLGTRQTLEVSAGGQVFELSFSFRWTAGSPFQQQLFSTVGVVGQITDAGYVSVSLNRDSGSIAAGIQLGRAYPGVDHMIQVIKAANKLAIYFNYLKVYERAGSEVITFGSNLGSSGWHTSPSNGVSLRNLLLFTTPRFYDVKLAPWTNFSTQFRINGGDWTTAILNTAYAGTYFSLVGHQYAYSTENKLTLANGQSYTLDLRFKTSSDGYSPVTTINFTPVIQVPGELRITSAVKTVVGAVKHVDAVVVPSIPSEELERWGGGSPITNYQYAFVVVTAFQSQASMVGWDANGITWFQNAAAVQTGADEGTPIEPIYYTAPWSFTPCSPATTNGQVRVTSPSGWTGQNVIVFVVRAVNAAGTGPVSRPAFLSFS